MFDLTKPEFSTAVFFAAPSFHKLRLKMTIDS